MPGIKIEENFIGRQDRKRRYVLYDAEELCHTAELWMRIGYRDHIATNEEIEKKRGNGIGTSLIHKAEDYARELGVADILFHVEKTNTSAFRLYERLGYKIFRDDGNRYLMKGDANKNEN